MCGFQLSLRHSILQESLQPDGQAIGRLADQWRHAVSDWLALRRRGQQRLRWRWPRFQFRVWRHGQYWLVNGDPKILGQFAANGSTDPHQWFATKNPDGSPIFVQPTAGTFVHQRVRNLIYQPGFQNWNLGSLRVSQSTNGWIPVPRRAFNFINHPNLGGGSGGGVNFDPTSAILAK